MRWLSRAWAGTGRAFNRPRGADGRRVPTKALGPCLAGFYRRSLGVSLALLAVAAGSIAAAQGSEPARSTQDPLAPVGAGPRWLPCEDWVMYHWVPYDERRLFSMLATDRAAVELWLEDDDIHTLAQLIRRRGLDPGDVAQDLVSAWAGDAPARHQALLVDRALRTLTEGHLAQHVFFHLAHYPAVALRARTVFGIAPLSYQRFRLAGWTPSEIAGHHGRTSARVRRLTVPILRDGARAGVAGLETPPAQAQRVFSLQRSNLAAWLEQRIRPPGRVPRMDVPVLRSRKELACWLFAGRDGLRQVRRPSPTRAASLACALPKRKDRT